MGNGACIVSLTVIMDTKIHKLVVDYQRPATGRASGEPGTDVRSQYRRDRKQAIPAAISEIYFP